MNEDIVVPIIIFGSICAIVLLPIYWRTVLRRRVLETVKEMAHGGTPLSPELIAGLMGPMAQTIPTRQRDVRNGYVMIAVAIGIALVGLAASVIAAYTGGASWAPALGAGIAAVGAVPGCVGVAFLLLGFGQKREA